jgi:hypothetical protein
MITCKSPVAIVKAALELGRQLFADHPHQFGPQTFTEPQLFACLSLREHQKKSYRGVEALLVDCSDLRAAAGLPRAPDHNTLCRAFKRLVKSKSMGRALDLQVDRAKAMGLDVAGDDAKPSAMDSTCLESHHVSRHFERRKEGTAAKSAAAAAMATEPAGNAGKPAKTAASLTRSKTVKAMPKLSIAVACSCHLILAARASVGMGSDHPHFAPLLFDAWRRAEVRVMTADAGYDSEENHRVGWDEAGVATVIPPLIGRPTTKDPTGRYRRLMKEVFATATAGRAAYGQRWQVETVNSMIKRNLGSALRARTPHRRSMEMILRCVVHNTMVLEGTES